jgi:hypothetical protein
MTTLNREQFSHTYKTLSVYVDSINCELNEAIARKVALFIL